MATPTLNAVALCNRALARIGETDFIETLDEARLAAEVCSRLYDDIFTKALEAFAWPFATRFAVLSEPAGVTVNGWEYVYSLPDDMLRAVALVPEDSKYHELVRESRVPFDIVAVSSGDGRYLVTDAEVGNDFDGLQYIARCGSQADTGEWVDDLTTYPRHFLEFVIWLLAAELALAIRKEPQLADYCAAQAERAKVEAIALSMHSREPGVLPETPSISARG